MKKLIESMKKFGFRQLLSLCLVGLLLVVSTACSNTRTYAKTSDQERLAGSGKTSSELRPEIPAGATSSEYKGGMNDYSDVDPRMSTSRADRKAESLQGQVERNLARKGADTPGEFAENYRQGAPLGERAQKLAEDIGSSAKETQTGLAKGTQRGVENIRENLQGAAESTQQQARETARSTSEALEETGTGIQRTAEDTSDYIQRRAQDAAKRTQRAMEDASRAAS